MILQNEFKIHHSRTQILVKQLHNDVLLIRQYLNVHTSGKLTPTLEDPKHLRKELVKIFLRLPFKLALPENPKKKFWHYYRFLTVTPITHDNKLILIIKIALIDLDSTMTLYKIYNFPICIIMLAYHSNTTVKEIT